MYSKNLLIASLFLRFVCQIPVGFLCYLEWEKDFQPGKEGRSDWLYPRDSVLQYDLGGDGSFLHAVGFYRYAWHL